MIKQHYLNLRMLIRSESIGIDLNDNLFNHPVYNDYSIIELDEVVKEKSFNNHFHKISSKSYNISYDDILCNTFSIVVTSVLTPKKSYKNIHLYKGFKKFWTDCCNRFYRTKKVKIKPNRVHSIPLSIKIIPKTLIPMLSFELNPELHDKGLRIISIDTSRDNTVPTNIIVANTSNKTITIEDLSYVGEIFFLK